MDKLLNHERLSAVWKKISEHLAERLDVAREKNDCLLSPDDTAIIRGRIAAYKEILALGEPDTLIKS